MRSTLFSVTLLGLLLAPMARAGIPLSEDGSGGVVHFQNDRWGRRSVPVLPRDTPEPILRDFEAENRRVRQAALQVSQAARRGALRSYRKAVLAHRKQLFERGVDLVKQGTPPLEAGQQVVRDYADAEALAVAAGVREAEKAYAYGLRFAKSRAKAIAERYEQQLGAELASRSRRALIAAYVKVGVRNREEAKRIAAEAVEDFKASIAAKVAAKLEQETARELEELRVRANNVGEIAYTRVEERAAEAAEQALMQAEAAEGGEPAVLPPVEPLAVPAAAEAEDTSKDERWMGPALPRSSGVLGF